MDVALDDGVHDSGDFEQLFDIGGAATMWLGT